MNPIKQSFNSLSFEHPGELKKFIKMGFIFCTILAVYWTLGTIKESLLTDHIGNVMLPYAKIISLFFLIPSLFIYTRLLDFFSREKIFIYISLFYALCTLFFAFYIDSLSNQTMITLYNLKLSTALLFCFSFYAFVESYGSIIVALFWALATSTTQPESAKKGFPLIVGLGQVGGIVGPFVLCKVPRYFHVVTLSPILYASTIVLLISCSLFYYFLKTTPRLLLHSYQGLETINGKKQTPSFFEGWNLILKNYYLIGILFIIFFFEFTTQIFDYDFKCFANEQLSGLELAEYFSLYGSAVNGATLLCLLLGINKINSFFGITYSLLLIPLLIGLSTLGLMVFHNASMVFIILVFLKAINFALTIPTTKQLYIPTSSDVRFKAQAWIDTFGSRMGRQLSGIYAIVLNSLSGPLMSFCLVPSLSQFTNSLFLFLTCIWFFIALYIGKKHNKALKNNAQIC